MHTFACVARAYPMRRAVDFLHAVRTRFNAHEAEVTDDADRSPFASAPAFDLQRVLDEWNASPQDTVSRVQQQLAENHSVMSDNAEKLRARGERLFEMDDRVESVHETSSDYRTYAATLQAKARTRKMQLMFGAGAIATIILILLIR